jgi:hypothetical protein
MVVFDSSADQVSLVPGWVASFTTVAKLFAWAGVRTAVSKVRINAENLARH